MKTATKTARAPAPGMSSMWKQFPSPARNVAGKKNKKHQFIFHRLHWKPVRHVLLLSPMFVDEVPRELKLELHESSSEMML